MLLGALLLASGGASATQDRGPAPSSAIDLNTEIDPTTTEPALTTPASTVPTAAGSAASSPSPGPALFALVVGNNRSLALEQPDLHYADDDAVKYGQLFRALGAEERVHVLTRPDAPTQALFGEGPPPLGPPTVEAFWRTAKIIRDQVASARQEGAETTFYFVFAGHGDEERGRGYLELEDGRFFREDVIRLIETISPHRAHLLLDSCNSFFVIHPRRPGGRAWTTASDITEKLEVPGTDVGVFLSTSAEAQVYEWSQLQSGVFSHAVRSALMGAADADLDRRVTYRELDAFVTTASSGIQNALYRPHLYARTPRDTDLFLDLSAVPNTFALSGFDTRITLRDQRGVRVADVNPEPGFTPRLVRWTGLELTVIAEAHGDDGRHLLYETMLGSASEVSPPLTLAADTPRGAQALFAQYFRTPYGPNALAAQQVLERNAPPKIFGLTAQQESRFAMQLHLMAAESRKQQVMRALTGVLVGIGAGALVGVPLVLASVYVPNPITINDGPEVTIDFRGLGGISALPFGGLAGLSLIDLLTASSGEKILKDFQSQSGASAEERSIRVARAADALAEQAESNMRGRYIKAAAFGLGGLLLASLGAGSIASMGDTDPPAVEANTANAVATSVIGGVGLVTGLIFCGVAIGELLNPSPEETFLEVMRRDPESVLRVE